MKKVNCNCIQCEVECKRKKDVRKASFTVLIGEQEIPLCKKHYEQFREDNIIFESV